MTTDNRAGRVVSRVLAGVVLVAVGAAAAWAVLTVVRPAEDPLTASPFTYVEVTSGEVGSSINLNTVAEWTTVPVGENRAQGVVTAVTVAAGDEVSQGAVLYFVDERPVVIAQGAVPMYRMIGEKAVGTDVAQLQQLLAALGHYDGGADGEAGWGTITAIKAWQKSLGLEATGTVGVADIIFVPSLPTRVSLDTEVIVRGATLVGGESIVKGLPASPSFTIPVTDGQAAMMPTGTRVEVTSPSGTLWEAFVTDQVSSTETQTITVNLTGADDTLICLDACAEIPVTGEARLASRIVTVEPVSGLVVPSAALVTSADGTVGVIDKTGTRHSVSVLAAARGMSVIEGVDAGTSVRVPGATGGGK